VVQNAVVSGSPCEIGSWLCCLASEHYGWDSHWAATLLGSSSSCEPVLLFSIIVNISSGSMTSTVLLLSPDRWDNKYTECREQRRQHYATTSFSAVAALYWKMCAHFEKSCRVTCLLRVLWGALKKILKLGKEFQEPNKISNLKSIRDSRIKDLL